MSVTWCVMVLCLCTSVWSPVSKIPTHEDHETKKGLLSDKEHFEHNAKYDRETLADEEEAERYETLSPEQSEKPDKDADKEGVAEEELNDHIRFVRKRLAGDDVDNTTWNSLEKENLTDVDEPEEAIVVTQPIPWWLIVIMISLGLIIVSFIVLTVACWYHFIRKSVRKISFLMYRVVRNFLSANYRQNYYI